MLSFGVTVLPDPPYTRLVDVLQRGEELGFEYGWTYDSHILWQESYALLAVAATQTERIKLGHCVTNPGIRDPTITASWYATMQDISDGRMVMGIGRGDSSRRVVGLKPVKADEFERRRRIIKHLMDLIERYGEHSDEIPAALTDFVKARKFYDYKEHSRVGAKHGEFVTDEICDRFCVLGTPEQITAKLRELESIGVDQFDIYLMPQGQDETLEAYGKEIIPQFTGVAA